jgi:hypothetical protein
MLLIQEFNEDGSCWIHPIKGRIDTKKFKHILKGEWFIGTGLDKQYNIYLQPCYLQRVWKFMCFNILRMTVFLHGAQRIK